VPVQNPPAGYHSVSPYLATFGVAKLIEFLEHVFDATVTEKMSRPDGGIQHCEIRIGDSIVMMGEPADPASARPSSLYVYVPDVDATYRRAIERGAKSEREPANQFYGDRGAAFIDASGNRWWIATHVEDVSPDELQRRMQSQKH
jgi:PhnB protein